MLKMALKNTFSPFPKTFAFWFGTLLATLLALLLVARVAFPFWIENKNYISGQLEEFLDSPVTFEHIQGDWSGWSPKFNLSNFSVYDKTNKSIIFSARRIEIKLNILRSIAERQIMLAKIKVSDSKFSIVREENGNFYLGGSTSMDSEILQRLFYHESLFLTSKEISFFDKSSSKKSLISNFKFKTQVGHGDTVINGEAQLSDPMIGKIRFKIKPSDEIKIDDFTGQINIWLSGLDSSLLTQKTSLLNSRLDQHELELLCWTDLQNGTIKNIDYKVTAIRRLSLTEESSPNMKGKIIQDVVDYEITGNISKDKNEYLFYSSLKLEPQLANRGGSLIGAISFHSGSPNNFFFYGEDIPLEFTSLLNPANFFEDITQNESWLPKGNIETLAIAWDKRKKKDGNFRLVMDVGDFSILSANSGIYLSGTGFKIDADEHLGNIFFNNRNIDLKFLDQIERTFSLTDIGGTLKWKKNNLQEVTILAENFQGLLDNNSLQFQALIKRLGHANSSVLLSAKLNSAKANLVRKIISQSISSERAVSWLNSNLLAGNFSRNEIYLKTPLCCYDNTRSRKSELVVHTEISNGKIRFSENSPVVSDLYGTLSIANEALSFGIESGEVEHFKLSNAHISTPNFSKTNNELMFFGILKGEGKHIANLNRVAPFKNLSFSLYNELSLDNNIKLKVWFRPTNLKTPKHKFSITTYFKENRLRFKNTNLSPIVLSGSMNFSNNGVNGKDLEASIGGETFSIEVETKKKVSLQFQSTTKKNSGGELIFHPYKNNQIPRITIKTLRLVGQNFKEHDLKIDTNERSWILNLKGDQVIGKIFIPKSPTLSNYKLIMKKLDIREIEKITETDLLSFDAPNIEASIKSFIYRNLELGELDFKLSNKSQVYRLDDFELNGEDINIKMEGFWKRSTGLTKCKIDATGETLAAMLSLTEIDLRGLEAKKSTFLLDAQWRGTPFDFNFANMDGVLNLTLREGRLLDLEPGTSRLFGLMSLQALPRRLSLDFDDLFRKGLFFDYIDGEFLLEKGTAATENMILNGPSVLVEVSGKTNLNERTYDQRAFVTPKLSDSIPMASALLGPVGLGAGAVYYLSQKVFKSIPGKVDEILKKGYLIRGNWENPTVSKIEE